MNYVILAAGQGSRMKDVAPKPLVEVGGKTLLRRMIDIIGDDAHTVVVANAAIPEIAKSVPSTVKVIEATPPSGAHSLQLGIGPSNGEPTIAITVDSYFSPEAFHKFVEEFKKTDADAYMGVTSYIDDETPLYVETDNDMNVTAFADFSAGHDKFVSAGVYGLNRKAMAMIPKAMAMGVNGLREIQRAVLLTGLKAKAFDMGKALDVDRPEDLETARRCGIK